MSQSTLNHQFEARAALARLRELMQDTTHKDDIGAHGFLREAVDLIGGKPTKK